MRAQCETYFAEQEAAEVASLQAKEALCTQAEALADSTDWIRTADELKRLQTEWQKSGPVTHERGRALWQRFRTACDRFFTRRKEDLSKRKHVWAENAQKKEAICVRAEELAVSSDWDTASNELKRLQIEWKAIGPVKKQRSEALWLRFRKACDTFFERYKQRDQIEASRAVSAREAVCAELEVLVPPDGAPATPPEDLARVVLDVWQRWQQAPRVSRPAADGVQERFDAALSRVLQAWPNAFRGTRLDVDANLDRMESLCAAGRDDGGGQRAAGRSGGHGAGTPGDAAQGRARLEHHRWPRRRRCQAPRRGRYRARRAAALAPARACADRSRSPARGALPSRLPPLLRADADARLSARGGVSDRVFLPGTYSR